MTSYEREIDIVYKVVDLLREALPDSLDVVTEYRISKGWRVDIVIVNGFEILAAIEVKTSIREEILETAKKQILRYQQELNCQWAIVTDGKHYFAHSRFEEEFSFREIKGIEELTILIVDDETKPEKDSGILKEKHETALWSLFIKELCEKFSDKVSTLEDVISVLSSVTTLNSTVSSTEYSFEHDFENQLFQALLGRYDKEKLVRYLPLASAYRTLNDQTIGMVSLVGMNDISECYYADRYISDNGGASADILPAENTLLNNTFILSCNDYSMLDDLTLWRLYGNGCRGTCLTFEVDAIKLNADNSFLLAPVSYGQSDEEHYELDLVKYLQTHTIAGKKLRFDTWCYWKHFFKHHRYAVEREVRLLYTGKGCGRKNWILTYETEIPCTISVFDIRTKPNHSNDFPLTLSEVMLGSKCDDTSTKQRQFQELIKERNKGYTKGFAKVEISKIDNYR